VDLNQKREFSDGLFHQSSGSFELVLAPVILSLVGLGLDRWLGLRPLCTLGWAWAGMIGSWAKQYYSYRSAMEQQRAQRAGAGLP
jgi:hypothetical protein